MPDESSFSAVQQTIVIQSVTKESIMLILDGAVQEIRNQFDELRPELKQHQTGTVQYAEKIFNFEHITVSASRKQYGSKEEKTTNFEPLCEKVPSLNSRLFRS